MHIHLTHIHLTVDPFAEKYGNSKIKNFESQNQGRRYNSFSWEGVSATRSRAEWNFKVTGLHISNILLVVAVALIAFSILKAIFIPLAIVAFLMRSGFNRSMDKQAGFAEGDQRKRNLLDSFGMPCTNWEPDKFVLCDDRFALWPNYSPKPPAAFRQNAIHRNTTQHEYGEANLHRNVHDTYRTADRRSAHSEYGEASL